ncbi:MAG: MarR family transcriptional regulator [Bdellovibrionales bacterium]|nr:MarR family transcriptional regulator [Bdellovibrionales bacterium]
MPDDDDPLRSLIQVGILIQQFNKDAESLLEISLVQWYLLTRLRDLPGTSASKLARSVGVNPSTLTQSIKRLERKGYIHTTWDGQDSRRKCISLTSTGQRVLTSADKSILQWRRGIALLKSDLARMGHFLTHLDCTPQ